MARRSTRSSALSATHLARRLERDVPPVIVLAGAERWFREEGLRQIVGRVLPDGDSGASLAVFDTKRPEDRAGVSGAIDELRSAALFGGGKVVAIENADAAAGPWAKGRKSPLRNLAEAGMASQTPGSVLVLLTARPVRGQSAIPAGAIGEAGALVVDCRALYDAPAAWKRGAPPYDHELSRWIGQRLAEVHGKRIDLADAHALSRLVGSRPGDLAAALTTLATYVGDREAVNEEDVQTALGATRTDPAWRLSDAVADRDPDTAFALLESAFARGVPDGRGGRVSGAQALFNFLVAALHRTWRRLLTGAEGLSRGEKPQEVAKAAGIPSFKADVFLEQCRRDPAELLERHAAFLEAEAGVKGGGVPPRVALERLVARLSAP